MKRKGKTKEELTQELAKMRRRLAQLEALESQHRQREKELIESEERHRSLVELCPKAIAVHSKGEIVYINPAGAKMLGVASPEELIGKLVMDFVHPDYREIIKNRVGRSVNKGKAAPLIEEKLIRPDGSIIYVETVATRITYLGEAAMLAVSRDITERKKMEERLRLYEKKLRSLAYELTQVEEREHRHVATELRDAIGQLLAFCKIKLEELKELVIWPDAVHILREIRGSVEKMIEDSRSLSNQLSPLIVYELGLPAALEWLADKMRKEHNIHIGLEVDSQVNVEDEELRIFLFRAAWELLVNVSRHAKTHWAKVSMYREAENLYISVEDRGVGFNASLLEVPSEKNRRFGLFSIRERFSSFGGEVSIQSKSGKGTKVVLTVPLKAPQGKR